MSAVYTELENVYAGGKSVSPLHGGAPAESEGPGQTEAYGRALSPLTLPPLKGTPKHPPRSPSVDMLALSVARTPKVLQSPSRWCSLLILSGLRWQMSDVSSLHHQNTHVSITARCILVTCFWFFWSSLFEDKNGLERHHFTRKRDVPHPFFCV